MRGAAMSEGERLDVALTGEAAALVRRAVERGDYASGADLVQEALREWQLRRGVTDVERATLRRLWDEGVASGPGRHDGIDAIKREARRRNAAAGAPRQG